MTAAEDEGLRTRPKPGGLRAPICRSRSADEVETVRSRVWRSQLSSTTGGDNAPTAGAAVRLGFTPGMVIQELGWDEDTDDGLRLGIEDAIDAEMVDAAHGNGADAVVLRWRGEHSDLLDALLAALLDLVGSGAIGLVPT